jgi:hypothetical protein
MEMWEGEGRGKRGGGEEKGEEEMGGERKGGEGFGEGLELELRAGQSEK